MADPMDDEVEKFIADHAHLRLAPVKESLQLELDRANQQALSSAQAIHVGKQGPEVSDRLRGSIRESLSKRKLILSHASALGITLEDSLS